MCEGVGSGVGSGVGRCVGRCVVGDPVSGVGVAVGGGEVVPEPAGPQPTP